MVLPAQHGTAERAVAALRLRSGVLLTGVDDAGVGDVAERVAWGLAGDGWHPVRVVGVSGARSRPLAALSLAGLAPRPTPGDVLGAARGRVLEAAVHRPTLLVVRRADLLDDETRAVLASLDTEADVVPLLTSAPPRAARTRAVGVMGARPVVTLAVAPLRFDVRVARHRLHERRARQR